jgi:CHASE3 domain sensor protein
MTSRHGGIDVQRLIAAVAARHNILLKPDDAAFALVTMNQLVLEELVERVEGRIGASLAAFEASTKSAERRAARLIADEVEHSGARIRQQIESDIGDASLKARKLLDQVAEAHRRLVSARATAIAIIAALILCLVAFWAGVEASPLVERWKMISPR